MEEGAAGVDRQQAGSHSRGAPTNDGARRVEQHSRTGGVGRQQHSAGKTTAAVAADEVDMTPPDAEAARQLDTAAIAAAEAADDIDMEGKRNTGDDASGAAQTEKKKKKKRKRNKAKRLANQRRNQDRKEQQDQGGADGSSAGRGRTG